MSSMTGVQSVGHLSGEHATDLLGVDRYAPLIKVFGLDKAREIVQWDRTYGTHYVLGVEWNGQLDEMCLNEMPAIATYLIRDDPRLKSPLPTRQEVLDFTAAQDWRRDPEDEITSAIKKSFDTETKDIPMLRREFGDDPRVDKAEAALADRLVLEQQKKALNRRHKPDPGLLDFSGRELFRFGFTKLEIHAMPKRTDADAAAAARHRAVLEAVEQKRARDAGNAIVAQRDAADIKLPPVTSLTELLAEADDPVRFRIEGLWPADGAKASFPAQAGAGEDHHERQPDPVGVRRRSVPRRVHGPSDLRAHRAHRQRDDPRDAPALAATARDSQSRRSGRCGEPARLRGAVRHGQRPRP